VWPVHVIGVSVLSSRITVVKWQLKVSCANKLYTLVCTYYSCFAVMMYFCIIFIVYFYNDKMLKSVFVLGLQGQLEMSGCVTCVYQYVCLLWQVNMFIIYAFRH